MSNDLCLRVYTLIFLFLNIKKYNLCFKDFSDLEIKSQYKEILIYIFDCLRVIRVFVCVRLFLLVFIHGTERGYTSM